MYVLYIFLILDQVIWECNLYDAIIPEKCKFFVRTRLEVKLKKKKPGVQWRTFRDDMVHIYNYILKVNVSEINYYHSR